jgi:hypothetical protein
LKEINIKKKINFYKKKGWHKDIVSAYNLYLKTKDSKVKSETKRKIENHYPGKQIIWENQEELKKEDIRLNRIINRKKRFLDKAFFDYSTKEKVEKVFRKKEIKIGKIVTNYLVKKILLKEKFKITDFSIITEIIILEKIINKNIVNLKTDKIIQKPLKLEKVKQKILNIKRNENNFYSFLDEYLSFIFKSKKIEIGDFQKRNLILLLINEKRIKYENYGLTKKDLIKIKHL